MNTPKSLPWYARKAGVPIERAEALWRQAVQAALNKVTAMMLDTHLHTCMMTAVRGQDMAERERMLVEVTAVFEMSNKY